MGLACTACQYSNEVGQHMKTVKALISIVGSECVTKEGLFSVSVSASNVVVRISHES